MLFVLCVLRVALMLDCTCFVFSVYAQGLQEMMGCLYVTSTLTKAWQESVPLNSMVQQ